jgi:hypothetical protein
VATLAEVAEITETVTEESRKHICELQLISQVKKRRHMSQTGIKA